MWCRMNELKEMFGPTDYKTRLEEEITYMDFKKDFREFAKKRNFVKLSGGDMEANWLYEMLSYQHHPCNRVMAVMPLVVFQVECDKLTDAMRNELYGTIDDLKDGFLDELPIEEREEIKKDIDYCLSIIK